MKNEDKNVGGRGMKRIATQILGTLALALCICGCESDNSDNPTVNVTGTWVGTLTV